MQNTGNVFLQVSRILLGVVFIFSGFVKAIDPLGFTYKIDDYLSAFGGFFTHITPLAFTVAVALSTIELMIGLNFLFQVRIRLTSVLALLFMLVMTPLTLYIALKNPVSDCGCFGEALKITNWQTFYKNIVLITLVILALVYNKKFRPLFLERVEWILAVVFIVIGIGLSVYSYQHLPLIDFLPYKTGVNIPQAMSVPENAAADKYETTFIYQKNGVQKEFTLENYPKDDSTWVFVDQKSVLISKGFEAPIHDFSIVNAQFEDITDDVLYHQGYTFLMIAYDLTKTSEDGAKQAERIYQKFKVNGIGFYALTASSDDEIQAFIRKTGITIPFCKTDPTTLKTVIRANPGLVLLKNGTIVGKWNWRDFLND